MTTNPSLPDLSDTDLLAETERLATQERESTADLIVALRELDARRLYLAEGYPSLYFYCTDRLHLSEQGAYRRIEVARLSRALPEVLDALRAGALTLTTALVLAPHLRPDNATELLAAAAFLSKRDVEKLVAERFRGPDDRGGYKIQFTADHDTYEKLMQAQALMRHENPHGLYGPIVNKALTLLIAHIERQRLGIVERPRKVRAASPGHTRDVPRRVRRAVWRRDGGQCAFRGPHGRCPARSFLEFHHVHPYALGGEASIENIELRCRAHNLYEAELQFAQQLTHNAPS